MRGKDTNRTEDARICNVLRSMLSTWDSLTEAQKKDAERKATYIAERNEVQRRDTRARAAEARGMSPACRDRRGLLRHAPLSL